MPDAAADCMRALLAAGEKNGAIIIKALEAATEALKEDEKFDPWQG